MTWVAKPPSFGLKYKPFNAVTVPFGYHVHHVIYQDPPTATLGSKRRVGRDVCSLEVDQLNSRDLVGKKDSSGGGGRGGGGGGGGGGGDTGIFRDLGEFCR